MQSPEEEPSVKEDVAPGERVIGITLSGEREMRRETHDVRAGMDNIVVVETASRKKASRDASQRPALTRRTP